MPHKRLGGDLLGSFCGALGLGDGNTEQVWEPRLAPSIFWEVMSGEFPLEAAGFVLPVLAPVRSGTNDFPRERRVAFHFAREKEQEDMRRWFFLSSNPQNLLFFFLDLHHMRNPKENNGEYAGMRLFQVGRDGIFCLEMHIFPMRCHLGARCYCPCRFELSSGISVILL